MRQLESLSLNTESLPADLGCWKTFLERIHRVYTDNDNDRYLVERSLEISSREMQEHWHSLNLEKARSLHSEKFATLGEMAAGIAHEINNPIGLIGVLTGQILELLEDENVDQTQIKNNLEQIDKSVWRISKIINSLRGFSRDGSADVMTSVTMGKILDDVFIFCTERFKQHNIEFKIGAFDRAWPVKCRDSEICQVVLNLLNNAFDAVNGSTDGWIELTIEKSDAGYTIGVGNGGPRLSAEVQRKLFQPFFTTKPVGKGTGLGLSISRKIAESHGGKLEWDGSSAHTRFILFIPDSTSPVRKVSG